jgi:hypothetical protein
MPPGGSLLPHEQLRAGANPAIVRRMSSPRDGLFQPLPRLIAIAGLGGLLLLRPARR